MGILFAVGILLATGILFGVDIRLAQDNYFADMVVADSILEEGGHHLHEEEQSLVPAVHRVVAVQYMEPDLLGCILAVGMPYGLQDKSSYLSRCMSDKKTSSMEPIKICRRPKYFSRRKMKKLLLKYKLQIKTDEVTSGWKSRYAQRLLFIHDFYSGGGGKC